MDSAFKYAQSKGIELESDYPYEARDRICRAKAALGQVRVKSFTDVTSKNASQLIAALQIGPVSVAIEADQVVFGQYKSGIINDKNCGE